MGSSIATHIALMSSLAAFGCGSSRPVLSDFGSMKGVESADGLSAKRELPHDGVDIGPLSVRAEVIASEDGVVSTVDRSNHGDWFVIIRHDNAANAWIAGIYWTAYGHLYLATVRQGERVRRGTVIGRVGESFAPSTRHVHWQVCRDRFCQRAYVVNPMLAKPKFYSGGDHTGLTYPVRCRDVQ